MGKGRPSLAENPHADRVLVRNFINKHGEEQFRRFLKLAFDTAKSKSSIARTLEVGFGTVSRLSEAVFEPVDGGTLKMKESVREFLLKFYGFLIN